MHKIFCRNKLKIHRNRAAFYYDFDFLFDYAAEIIATKLNHFNKNSHVLELSARRGNLTKHLNQYFTPTAIISTDISAALLQQSTTMNKIVTDEEQLCFAPHSFDLIFALLNIQWINNLPLFLQQVKTILKPGGSLVANFIGGSSLYNLKRNFTRAEMLSNLNHINRFSPLITHATITQLLQQLQFKNIVTEQEIVTVTYQNINNLFTDLRYMGEAAAFNQTVNYNITKQLLQNLLTIYSTTFDEQFEIITFTVNI